MEGEISTACTKTSVGICYFSEEFATDLFPVPGILTLALALALALTLTPGFVDAGDPTSHKVSFRHRPLSLSSASTAGHLLSKRLRSCRFSAA